MFTKVKSFISETIRVLKITKKPTKTEFSTVVKVSAMGIALIGILGFTIAMVRELI